MINYEVLSKLQILTASLFLMTNLGRCESFPCQNGATCTDLGFTDYQCQCSSDYEGPDCEIRITSEELHLFVKFSDIKHTIQIIIKYKCRFCI